MLLQGDERNMAMLSLVLSQTLLLKQQLKMVVELLDGPTGFMAIKRGA